MARSKYLNMTAEELEARLTRVKDLAMVNVVEKPEGLPDGTTIWQWTDKAGNARTTIATAKWDAEMYGVGMYSVGMADYDPRTGSWGSTSGQAPSIVEAVVKFIESTGWFSDVE